MKITIKHFAGQYPSFNVSLANEGKEPFIEIKGLRIVNGNNGEFVSWPSRKKDDGTYWNHVYVSNDFNAAVLQKARVGQTQQAPAPRSAPRPTPAPQPHSGFEDMDSDIPF